MLDTYKFVPDPLLHGNTLVASFATARELRCLLQECDWTIESSPTHTADQVNVSPEIHEQLCQFMNQMSEICS